MHIIPSHKAIHYDKFESPFRYGVHLCEGEQLDGMIGQDLFSFDQIIGKLDQVEGQTGPANYQSLFAVNDKIDF